MRLNGYYIVVHKKRPKLIEGKRLPHRTAEETQRETAGGGGNDDEFQLLVVNVAVCSSAAIFRCLDGQEMLVILKLEGCLTMRLPHEIT